MPKKVTKPEFDDDAHFTEGEEEARELVAKFLKDLTDSTEVESGFKVRLMLAGKGQESPVDSFTFDLSYDAKDFSEDVVSRAAQDCQHYRGVIKYAVRAFVGGRDRRVVFKLNVPRSEEEEEDEFGDDLEEAPTVRGAFHQAMRHNEVLMKEHRHGMVLIVKSLEGQINTKDSRIRELEARLREYQDREEDVSSLAWVRQLETNRIAGEENRKEKGLQFLQTAVPLLLGKVMDPNGTQNPLGGFGSMFPGNEAAPPTAEPPGYGAEPHRGGCRPELQNLHVRQDLLLDAVFAEITMDHVQQMMSVLPPTAIASLAELHRCVDERRATVGGRANGSAGPIPQEKRP